MESDALCRFRPKTAVNEGVVEHAILSLFVPEISEKLPSILCKVDVLMNLGQVPF